MRNGSEALPHVDAEEQRAINQYGRMVLWIKKHWFIVSLLLGWAWTCYQGVLAFRAEFQETRKEVRIIGKRLNRIDKKLGLPDWADEEFPKGGK